MEGLPGLSARLWYHLHVCEFGQHHVLLGPAGGTVQCIPASEEHWLSLEGAGSDILGPVGAELST